MGLSVLCWSCVVWCCPHWLFVVSVTLLVGFSLSMLSHTRRCCLRPAGFRHYLVVRGGPGWASFPLPFSFVTEVRVLFLPAPSFLWLGVFWGPAAVCTVSVVCGVGCCLVPADCILETLLDFCGIVLVMAVFWCLSVGSCPGTHPGLICVPHVMVP